MRALFLVPLVSALTVASAQPPDVPICTTSSECRQRALDAAETQDYEAFHTLAWRAVQTGKKNDTDLMYLLARAQSLSGRPDDALVMLRRLAGLGVAAVDAETNEDFRRARARPGWPEVSEVIANVGRSTDATTLEKRALVRAPTHAPRLETPAEPTGADAASARKTPSAVEAAPTASRSPAASTGAASRLDEGLAVPESLPAPIALDYDAVSHRFVLADGQTGTLKVLDEASGHLVDLVSRQWAGAYRTTALAIDQRRGDLWIAGAHEIDGVPQSAVHRMQLVSGRLLYTVPLPAEAGAARFTEVVVTENGVLVLDAAGRRLYTLSRMGKTFQLAARLDKSLEVSALAAGSDGTMYAAHTGGLVRVAAGSRRATRIAAGRGVDLRGLEWLAVAGRSLVGIQRAANGTHTAVRVHLDEGGVRAQAVEVIDQAVAPAGSVANGAFYYVAPRGSGASVQRYTLR